jgi:DivIVA domain-containing protein
MRHLASGREGAEMRRGGLARDPNKLQASGIGHTRSVVDEASSDADDREEQASGAPKRERGFGDLRHYVPADILNISFPVSVRGYDRRAVEAYVKRVNRVIAELKVSASPAAAVRHALDQAGQQVHGLLQSARETAEEITASARQEAEEGTARAKAEAAELVVNASAEADRISGEANELIAKARTDADEMVTKARNRAGETLAKAEADARKILEDAGAEAQTIAGRSRAEADERLRRLRGELAALRDQAETRMREIEADAKAVWEERGELLDDVRGMATALADLADAAAARFPRREPAQPDEEMVAPDPEGPTEPQQAAPDRSSQAAQAAGYHAAGGNESRDDVTESSPASRADA